MQSIQQSPQKWLTFDSVKSIARGCWSDIILPNAGVHPKFLSSKHGPCPVCGGHDRFRFDNKNGLGSFFCNNCGAGDGFRFIQLVHDCSPVEALRLVAGILGIVPTSSLAGLTTLSRTSISNANSVSTDEQKRRQAKIDCIWHESIPVIGGDPVWLYLTKTRGLPLAAVPDVLRLHPKLDYWENGSIIGTYPTMLAAVSSPSGAFVNLHRTYLTQDGKKAPVASPKKLMRASVEGVTSGAAIRLFEPNVNLAISEGIETALAVHFSTGFPVWATISASGMASLMVPSTIERVAIYADNDSNGTGQKAAQDLARRLYERGVKARILTPKVVGTDWHDIYLQEDRR